MGDIEQPYLVRRKDERGIPYFILKGLEGKEFLIDSDANEPSYIYKGLNGKTYASGRNASFIETRDLKGRKYWHRL